MRYPLSRAVSAATASYGVFAIAVPRHLGTALAATPLQRPAFDGLARTYGARDVAVGALGVLGRSDRTVTASVVLCIVSDLIDAVILSGKVTGAAARGKVLGFTLGWAALNAAALVSDRRRAAGWPST